MLRSRVRACPCRVQLVWVERRTIADLANSREHREATTFRKIDTRARRGIVVLPKSLAGLEGYRLKFRALTSVPASAEYAAVAFATTLLHVMVGYKGYLFWWYAQSGLSLLPPTRQFCLPLIFGADAFAAGVVALLALPVATLLRRHRTHGSYRASIPFVLLYVSLTLLLAVSLRINQLYNQPLTFRMIRYAAHGTIWTTILASLDGRFALSILFGVALWPLLYPSLEARLPRWRVVGTRLGLWSAVGLFATLMYGATILTFRHLHFNWGLRGNALIYFARSYSPMPIARDFESELKFAKRSGLIEKAQTFDLSSPQRPSSVRGANWSRPQGSTPLNLLFVLLESTPESAITHRITPRLHALRETSLRFPKHFTTAPYTFDAHYAIIHSQFARHAQMSLPALYGDKRSRQSLLAAFRRAGYRTAVFQSSWGNLLDMRWLYQHAAVETYVAAEDTLAGLKPGTPWGAPESLTIARLTSWLSGLDNHPFAAVFNLASPHLPYEFRPEDRVVPGASLVDDYYNALHGADTAVGSLLDWLENSSLGERTIVVVASDHGETIGDGHGFKFSADELLVPFWIRLPKSLEIHATQTVDIVTSHIDIAPTLAALFGIPPDKAWLGRNLLEVEVQRNCAMVDHVFGEQAALVDGAHAVLLERSSSMFQVHDFDGVAFHATRQPLPVDLEKHYRRLLSQFDRQIMLQHFYQATQPQ